MAYISASDVQAIRNELRAFFPKWKFAVRKGYNGLNVEVNILQGSIDFVEDFCAGPIAAENAARVRQEKSMQINEFWIDRHWGHAPRAAKILNQINEIMHNAPGRAGGKKFYDHSDIQTDYFDTAFYTHLTVGRWDRPYVLTK